MKQVNAILYDKDGNPIKDVNVFVIITSEQLEARRTKCYKYMM